MTDEEHEKEDVYSYIAVLHTEKKKSVISSFDYSIRSLTFERQYCVLPPSEYVRLTIVRRDVECSECVVLGDASIHRASLASRRFCR